MRLTGSPSLSLSPSLCSNAKQCNIFELLSLSSQKLFATYDSDEILAVLDAIIAHDPVHTGRKIVAGNFIGRKTDRANDK